MADKVLRTEVLTEERDGEKHYAVMELVKSGSQTFFRVHYGADVRRGNGNDWGSLPDDAHNVRVMAEALFCQMVDDNRRP